MGLSSDPCDVSWHFLAVPVLAWWLALSSHNCEFITCPRIVPGAVYNILVGTFHVLSLSERILLTASWRQPLRGEAGTSWQRVSKRSHDVGFCMFAFMTSLPSALFRRVSWSSCAFQHLIYVGCEFVNFLWIFSFCIPGQSLVIFFYRFETQSAAFVRVHVPESEPVLYNSCSTSVDARESDFLFEMVDNVCVSLRVWSVACEWPTATLGGVLPV